MLRLNIRQTMTRIGIHTQLSTLSGRMTRPEAHTEYEAPRSNMGVTQPELSIDSYPSRHAYGHTNNDDFAKQYGRQGKQDIKASTSKHTQQAWAQINNGAKPGNDEVVNRAKQALSSEINKQRYLVAEAIPDPQISCRPSEVVGEPDPGKYDWSVSVKHDAELSFNRGSVETYIQQKGQVRQWTTEDRYDIYA